jgi:hypothetical protein
MQQPGARRLYCINSCALVVQRRLAAQAMKDALTVAGDDGACWTVTFACVVSVYPRSMDVTYFPPGAMWPAPRGWAGG